MEIIQIRESPNRGIIIILYIYGMSYLCAKLCKRKLKEPFLNRYLTKTFSL